MEIINIVRQQKCLSCGKSPCDPHHVTTRGAGGKDTPSNLMPLCRVHHVEYHQIGPGKICEKYPKVIEWLIFNEREDVLSKIAR